MNRQTVLLAGLGVVLVLALFWMFAWQPKSEELAAVQAEVDATIAQAAQLEAEIRSLEEVRTTAPELEAALVAANALVPAEAALPSALRQLQLAADDSGVTLLSISPGRPAADQLRPEIARISLAISAEGSYFQLVDFLRRVEDPAITPRLITFDNLSVSVGEYPTLAVALTGSMFAQIEAPPSAEPEPEPTPTVTPEDDQEAAA